MMVFSIIAAFAALPMTATAQAQAPTSPITIFGMQLGEPISIPECPRRRRSDGTLSDITYERSPPNVCFERDIQLRDAPWRRGAITFPTDRIPLIMSGASGFTIIINGRLEGVEIQTLGHAHADGIIRELTEKFGRPTSVEADSEIIHGITVPSTTAIWRRPQGLIEYRSVDGDLEHGYLRIMTATYAALRAAHQRSQAEAHTPL